jgi:hypothetical protein
MKKVDREMEINEAGHLGASDLGQPGLLSDLENGIPTLDRFSRERTYNMR